MKFIAPALFAAAAFASPIQSDDKPPSDQVRINGVSANGSGCPSGSVTANFNSDRTILSLLFQKYEATIGPQSKDRRDARKACTVILNMHYPEGFQYSVGTFTTRGYADIDQGITGEVVSSYYFAGYAQDVSAKVTVQGPNHGGYTKSDRIDIKSLIWSPCGKDQSATVKTEVRLVSNTNDRNAGGLLTVDSIDTRVEQKMQYQLSWRRASCGRKAAFTEVSAENVSMELADTSVTFE